MSDADRLRQAADAIDNPDSIYVSYLAVVNDATYRDREVDADAIAALLRAIADLDIGNRIHQWADELRVLDAANALADCILGGADGDDNRQ